MPFLRTSEPLGGTDPSATSRSSVAAAGGRWDAPARCGRKEAGFDMSGLGARHSGARGFRLSGILRLGCAGMLLLAVAVMPLGVDVRPASAVDPTTYWVDVATGSDTGPGTKGEPFETLAKACSVALPSDTIIVLPGTYTTAGGSSDGLILNGASLVSTHGAASTIITGGGSNRLIWGQNFVGGDTIRGFTFTGGAGGSAGGVGGALRVQFDVETGASPLTIEDNVFVGNSSGGYAGGALAFYNTNVDPGEYHLLMRNNIFENNTCTPNDGGAVYIYGAVDTLIEANTFIGNTAGYGGAIKFNTKDKEVAVAGNTFSDNEATWDGGAIALFHQGTGGFEVHGNEIRTNSAGGLGGGIHSNGGILNLSGNLIADNGASQGGGVNLQGTSSVSAWNNLLDDCYASSGLGSAWYVSGTADLWEAHDTVVGNGGPGNPVVTHAEPSATLTIVNSVYRNTYAGTTEVRNADEISYGFFADTALAEPANGNMVGAEVTIGDPLLVGSGDRHLAAGSPCIDAANSAAGIPDDYRGTLRPYDGNGDGIAKPDMGYHEYVPPIQHDAAGVTFDRFVTGYNSAYSGGGYVYGRWTGTKLQARFTGDTIRWIGPKQPSYGKADVYLDGVKVATADCYAPLAQATTSALIWESDPLTDGAHTLEIRLVGQKNAASSGYVVVLDRFEVQGAAPKGGGTRHDEKSGTLSGPWVYGANSAYIAKGYNYSRYATAAFTKTFNGTRVAWIGPKTGNYGRAKVYIDGVLQGTVSQYGTTGWRYRVWESKSLPAGNHTLKIVPTGTKDAASKSTIIVIDAIDVR